MWQYLSLFLDLPDDSSLLNWNMQNNENRVVMCAVYIWMVIDCILIFNFLIWVLFLVHWLLHIVLLTGKASMFQTKNGYVWSLMDAQNVQIMTRKWVTKAEHLSLANCGVYYDTFLEFLLSAHFLWTVLTWAAFFCRFKVPADLYLLCHHHRQSHHHLWLATTYQIHHFSTHWYLHVMWCQDQRQLWVLMW
jgi:hypothetical protein